MDCVCDSYSSPYWAEARKARTPHKCCECNVKIVPGERYEHVRGCCEGDWFVADTCARCLELRAYIIAHVPCFCMEHGNMLQNALETVSAYAHEAPGLFMGYGRLLIAIRRAATQTAETGAQP